VTAVDRRVPEARPQKTGPHMGFEVNLDELATAESELRDYSENGEDVAALAADADPEWYIWGLPGLILAPRYFELADEVHGHLKDMHEALAAHAERIKICADSYGDKEEDNSTTMDAIQRRLDGK